MRYLYCDLETYSDIPIKNGLYRYAEHAEILIFAYAFEDNPVQIVDLTQDGAKIPDIVIKAWKDPKTISVWHNAQFDRGILKLTEGIVLDLERVHCTMAQAYAHSLPGGLDKLCQVMGVRTELAKHDTGKQLIHLFCKPRPKNQKLRRATRHSHPVEWKRFLEYAGNDIEAMRAIHKKMPIWNYQGFEKQLWNLDQEINDRGFCVDTDLVNGAIDTIKKEQHLLSERASDLTHGDLDRATQRDKLLTHLCTYYKVNLPNMQKSTLERRIDDPDLPWAVRELLSIRLQASTTSTAKYKKIIESMSSDKRLRGTLQFCGAARTGRWSGRTFQPQNLPRPTHSEQEIEAGIKALKMGCADLIEDNVMALTSSCIRGAIVAPEGKKLVVSDLSNIEGRAAAWLAGEEWKLKAFYDFDHGKGQDLYNLAYAKSFDIEPEDVTKDQRQIGKVQELALGYEGGVGAFVTFANLYGIDLEELAKVAWDNIPQTVKIDSVNFHQWWVGEKGNTDFGLTPEAYIVCDSFKRMWREAHPEISSYWPELRDAAISAIRNPGNKYRARMITFLRKGAWLRAIMPSGRSLCYPSPAYRDHKISYMGVCQYSRKWKRLYTYGGKLFENLCQATARDIMAANMPKAEENGYDILLTVHDELITEAPNDGCYNAEDLSRILATPPRWASDFPLAAGGYEARRYRKD
jgi:DNA polymerase